MARARNIKPGFFENEQLAELPFEARLLFIGLWTMADRDGRMEDRPKRIKMKLFAADDVDVEACLQGLHEQDLILRYEVDGKRYICIPAWDKHQRPHHNEAKSDIPPPQGSSSKDASAFDHGEKGGEPKEEALRPSSLIPDTGYLIPDTSCPVAPDAASVLDHLNEVTGSKFRKSKSSLENINARLREGHTPDDLKAVVDFKASEWGHRPEMAQYLRPKTLFAPEKFPGYLTAARSPPARYSDTTRQNITALREWANGGE